MDQTWSALLALLLARPPAILYDVIIKVNMQVVHRMRWHMMIVIACNGDEHTWLYLIE
jgi:hypothetical protein